MISKIRTIALLSLSLALLFGASLLYAQSNESLYSIDLTWHDDQAHLVKLSEYSNHYVILTMAYTACSTACPLTIQRLRNMEKDLGTNADKVEFVIITFDPARDTPNALAAYRSKHRLISRHWHFLSGTEQDTRKMAHLLEIAYEKNPKTGEILHSNKIVLLDRNGIIKTAADGLNSDTKTILDNISSN